VALEPPPRNFKSLPLGTKSVAVSRLYRLSRFVSGEPYFGRSAGNRFDDRSRPKAKRFGTCYCGFDLSTAIAETLLHDDLPVDGKFSVSYADFASRQLVRFKGATLVLADLTGASLKTLGGDGALSTTMPYRLPQLWAMAVHRHPQGVDGIYYISRHLNDRPAVAVFNRAAAKLGAAAYTSLSKARGALAAIAELHISFDYP
jgi:hypothetical protein